MGGAPPPSESISRSRAIARLATPALTTLWGENPPFTAGGEGLYRELNPTELFSRICARAPYFALRGVTEVGPGEVAAWLPVEQPPGAEASPMAISEVNRHLSVLGACAASLMNPSRGQHYYLPQRAWMERLHEEPLPRGSRLRGAAKADFHHRRGASATTLLSTPEGQPLFAMGVDYNVLHAESFLRLFHDAWREPGSEGAAPRHNPYAQPPVLQHVVHEGECLRGTLGPVELAWCEGHFTRLPVLPAAVVGGLLCGLAGGLLRQKVGDVSARYLVTHVDMRTESFAFAGETVRFDAHRQAAWGRDQFFDCWAAVDGRVVAVVELMLSCLD
jgi:hypothetical protein